MKKSEFFSTLLPPVLVMVLGLVLLINPDSASALVSAVLGWVLIAVAVVSGLTALLSREGRFGKVAIAILFAAAGGWLHANPLMLAAVLGRFCGIFLLVQGVLELIGGRRGLLSLALALIGLVLVLAPMSVSRILFSLCGAAMLVLGVFMLRSRLKGQKRLDPPEDPFTVDPL